MATENRTPDDLQEAVAATLRRLRGEVRNPSPAAAERVEPRLSPQAAEEPAPHLAGEDAPVAEPDLLTASQPEIPLAPTQRGAMPERPVYSDDPPRAKQRWIPYALSFAALVVFAGIVWWAYQAIMAGHKGGPVPVITADTTPAKIPPSDQSATDTPAQQQTVYDQISGTNNTQPKSEVLLPAPETPQTPPPPPAPVPSTTDAGGAATSGATTDTTATTTPPAATTQTLIPPAAPLAPDTTTSSTTSGAEGTTADTTQPTTADTGSSTVGQTTTTQTDAGQTTGGQPTTGTDTGTTAAVPPEPAPYEVPTLAPTGDSTTIASADTGGTNATGTDTSAAATAAPQTSSVADNFHIQLAALKTEAEANTSWKRILAKHNDVLGSLTVHIVKADLGAQGVYYRVQAGPFADKASAVAACDQLKTAGQQCLVKP